MAEVKELAFVAACKDFFGAHQGQGLADFMKEVKELTPEDKADMIKQLEATGRYKIKVAAP